MLVTGDALLNWNNVIVIQCYALAKCTHEVKKVTPTDKNEYLNLKENILWNVFVAGYVIKDL